MKYAYNLIDTPLPSWIEYHGVMYDPSALTAEQMAEVGWLPLYYEPPDELLGYADPVEETRDGHQVAIAYALGTETERKKAKADAKRAEYQASIDSQRRAYDQSQIDLRYDPGLIGLIDDANSRADAKLKQLGYTPDNELATFNPDISTATPSSVDMARSLALQERAWAQRAMDLSTEDEMDLLDSADAHEAIVTDGDASADVPLPPSSFRRVIGVFGEGYGGLEVQRVFSGGWWWLQARLTTKKDLSGGQYWLAFYSDEASNTAGDPVGYLTTAALTKTAEGVYTADKAAINLPRSTPEDEFLVTLCFNHLSAEQFDRVHLMPNDEYEFWSVRFGGSAV